jgi:multidrug transporter EmrE-like cation transporter
MNEDISIVPESLNYGRAASPVPWFLNPYLVLILGGALDCAGELLLKKGANAAPPMTGVLRTLSQWLGVSALFTPWTWMGISCYIGGLMCWLYVLKSIPLGIAFSIINGLHMGVPVGAYFILHEPVNARRWIGIAIVLAGVLLILKPVARAEEQL